MKPSKHVMLLMILIFAILILFLFWGRRVGRSPLIFYMCLYFSYFPLRVRSSLRLCLLCVFSVLLFLFEFLIDLFSLLGQPGLFQKKKRCTINQATKHSINQSANLTEKVIDFIIGFFFILVRFLVPSWIQNR